MTEKDYSGTPLWKKLGIKEGSVVMLVGAPAGFAARLGSLPLGVRSVGRAAKAADVIVLFSARSSEVLKHLPGLIPRLVVNGGLWIAYPKKSSGLATDLTFENVQSAGLGTGLVDNKSIAVDEVWSGVRFVRRLKDRPSVTASKRTRGSARRNP